MASEIKVDTISEKTSAGGVTIDGLLIKDGGISGDVSLIGTTPTFTIGDAGAEDAALVFDGNAQDYYIALDDSADDLLIGLGSTVGTTPAISIDENLAIKTYGDITMTGTTPVLTIGDAGAEDTAIVFDGNAKDFYVALDDSADKLVIGEGSTVGTNSILTITDDSVTIGDAAAVDTKIVFDGNAQDFYIGLDDSADDLIIGLGSAVGTTPAISINEDRDVTISDGAIDFDVASHDGSNGLKLAGTLVTATAAELNLLDGGTSVGSSITIADADGFVVNDGGTMKTIPATDIPTYVGGGIAEIDQWRLTSNLTAGSSETAITANLERVDAPTIHTGNLGTGMSESSGVFTFPSTGWWEVSFNVKFDLASGGDDRNVTMRINVTDDNSGYKYVGYQSESIHNETNSSSHAHIYHSVVLDIESTTNDKCKFALSAINGAAVAQGQTDYSRTYMKFIKLADT